VRWCELNFDDEESGAMRVCPTVLGNIRAATEQLVNAEPGGRRSRFPSTVGVDLACRESVA
jgi:hypothetical protein